MSVATANSATSRRAALVGAARTVVGVAVVALIGQEGSMAQGDNPNWGLNQADVNRLHEAATTMRQLLEPWSVDPRYSPQVGQLSDAADFVDLVAQELDDYLDVQGT